MQHDRSSGPQCSSLVSESVCPHPTINACNPSPVLTQRIVGQRGNRSRPKQTRLQVCFSTRPSRHDDKEDVRRSHLVVARGRCPVLRLAREHQRPRPFRPIIPMSIYPMSSMITSIPKATKVKSMVMDSTTIHPMATVVKRKCIRQHPWLRMVCSTLPRVWSLMVNITHTRNRSTATQLDRVWARSRYPLTGWVDDLPSPTVKLQIYRHYIKEDH